MKNYLTDDDYEFDKDGIHIVYESPSNPVKKMNIVSNPNYNGNTSTTTSPSSSSSTGSGTGYYSSNYNNYSSSSNYFQKVEYVFTINGIEVHGGSKTSVEGLSFGPDDLVINCTGTKITKTKWVMEQPSWLSIPYNDQPIQQLLLDWKDHGIPPKEFNLACWTHILEMATSRNLQNIYVCCTGGIGRTGTALASLKFASDPTQDPVVIIKSLREKYNKNCCETDGQIEYVLGLTGKPWSEIIQMRNSVKNISTVIVPPFPKTI